MLIAPGKSDASWRAFVKKLTPGGDVEIWAEAFDAYLLGRLTSRYLKPIKHLQEHGSLEGEGFTIVSIQCALIEFLAATRLGMNYRHRHPQPPHEYNNSSALFTGFLFQTPPFDKVNRAGFAGDRLV